MKTKNYLLVDPVLLLDFRVGSVIYREEIINSFLYHLLVDLQAILLNDILHAHLLMISMLKIETDRMGQSPLNLDAPGFEPQGGHILLLCHCLEIARIWCDIRNTVYPSFVLR